MTTPIPEPSLFRKKPVVVSAVQYPCTHPALRRCSCDANSACSSCGREFIMTLEGPLNVSPGDWIITGVQGEHYPCKPDIFAATYEPASGQPEPITVALDPDPRGVSVGVWQGSHCIYNGAHAVPVAPGDAQDGNDVLSWLEVEIGAISCRYYGDPSYDHDAYWMRDRVLKLIEDARRAFCTPAAGDALDAARYRWLRDHACNSLHLTRDGDHACNYLTAAQWIESCPEDFQDDAPEEIERMKATNTIWRLQVYPSTPIGFWVLHASTLDAAIDAALAAQVPQQGEA